MSSTNDGPAVSVDGLIFSYGAMRVLDQVALEVPTGEIFGLLGANGAGKTTLIRLLVGLLKPESGSVSVLGQNPSATRSTSVGYMPQLNALYEELSVEENVGFFARMYGMSDRSARLEAVESALQLVGLFDRRSDIILRLSGGMRQRVSLAIALAHSPSVLLLDEPTVGLDPGAAGGVLGAFQGDVSRRDHAGHLQSHDGRCGSLRQAGLHPGWEICRGRLPRGVARRDGQGGRLVGRCLPSFR